MTCKTTERDPQERLELEFSGASDELLQAIPSVQFHTCPGTFNAEALDCSYTTRMLTSTGYNILYRFGYDSHGIEYFNLLLQKVNKGRNQPRARARRTLENTPVFHQWAAEPQFVRLHRCRATVEPPVGVIRWSLGQLVNVLVQATFRVYGQRCVGSALNRAVHNTRGAEVVCSVAIKSKNPMNARYMVHS